MRRQQPRLTIRYGLESLICEKEFVSAKKTCESCVDNRKGQDL
jgi:hypothetical protein